MLCCGLYFVCLHSVSCVPNVERCLWIVHSLLHLVFEIKDTPERDMFSSKLIARAIKEGNLTTNEIISVIPLRTIQLYVTTFQQHHHITSVNTINPELVVPNTFFVIGVWIDAINEATNQGFLAVKFKSSRKF